VPAGRGAPAELERARARRLGADLEPHVETVGAVARDLVELGRAEAPRRGSEVDRFEERALAGAVRPVEEQRPARQAPVERPEVAAVAKLEPEGQR
jgi:hypothetical protein